MARSKRRKARARPRGKAAPKAAPKKPPKKAAPKPRKAPTKRPTAKRAPAPKPRPKPAQGPRKIVRKMVLTPEQQKLQDRVEAELKKARSKLSKAKAQLAKTKAGIKKLEAQEQRKKERKRRRKEREAKTGSESQTYKAKIGKTTHISATEVDGEPQYVWKELEERSADKLGRTKKGQKRKWARLVAEIGKESLLFPKNYRRLRGKHVIRTNWHPAHELVGRAAKVMDDLQQSGAIVPRAKIVIVESNKKPPRRVI